jgi:hypothetical protein
MASGFYSRPSSSFGYWRGGGSEIPLAQGQGSGMGQANSGAGILSQGQGVMNGTSWHPTVIYLLVLVVAEMVVFGFIARALR